VVDAVHASVAVVAVAESSTRAVGGWTVAAAAEVVNVICTNVENWKDASRDFNRTVYVVFWVSPVSVMLVAGVAPGVVAVSVVPFQKYRL
jgi:hypothetical protein